MKALDTNVLVRFLVNDDQIQADCSRRRLRQAEDRAEILWVPLAVVLETIWVLDSAYGFSRQDIIKALNSLVQMPILAFESPQAVHAFLDRAAIDAVDLADLLIGIGVKQSGCETVLTFDKKAVKTPLFENLLQEIELDSDLK